MITAFVVLVALLLSSFLALYIALTKRITAEIASKEKAAIEQKTATAKELVAKESDRQSQEVKNATSDELLARVRLRVLHGSNTSTTPGK